jgi:hypothetical protein
MAVTEKVVAEPTVPPPNAKTALQAAFAAMAERLGIGAAEPKGAPYLQQGPREAPGATQIPSAGAMIRAMREE